MAAITFTIKLRADQCDLIVLMADDVFRRAADNDSTGANTYINRLARRVLQRRANELIDAIHDVYPDAGKP